MATATLIRPGKAKPETVFFRQFPGKRRAERVSADDWMEPLPHKDIGGFGHILRLEADVRVWAPDGQLVMARKWPSRSYIRNFARLLRNIFGQSVQLVATDGTSVSTYMNAPQNSGLLPALFQFNTNTIAERNPELAGAGMAIGNGVPAEVHTRNDLVARVGGIYSSRQNVRTSVLTGATTTLEVTTGVTNGQAGSINVTEIGMYLYFKEATGNQSTIPWATLLAYDGFVAVPVAAGGVIAPRYTMDFPM